MKDIVYLCKYGTLLILIRASPLNIDLVNTKVCEGTARGIFTTFIEATRKVE
jgi:hypothetical protein